MQFITVQTHGAVYSFGSWQELDWTKTFLRERNPIPITVLTKPHHFTPSWAS